jgi:hypothetical protein
VRCPCRRSASIPRSTDGGWRPTPGVARRFSFTKITRPTRIHLSSRSRQRQGDFPRIAGRTPSTCIVVSPRAPQQERGGRARVDSLPPPHQRAEYASNEEAADAEPHDDES